MWCRSFNREPYNRSEVAKWVKREFGPILDKDRQERIAKELLDACRHQIRVRRRRVKQKLQVDHLTRPVGDDLRVLRLLDSRLGPARRWVPQTRSPDHGDGYMDACFYSGLIAGLIPTKMRLRRISDPNMLVYRQGFDEPRTRFVPHYITTVADAFIWLIPDEAREFLQLSEVRVEHDGAEQAVRLVTPWGTKLLPWRELVPTSTTT